MSDKHSTKPIAGITTSLAIVIAPRVFQEIRVSELSLAFAKFPPNYFPKKLYFKQIIFLNGYLAPATAWVKTLLRAHCKDQ